MHLITDTLWLNLSILEWALLFILIVIIPVESWMTQHQFRPLPATKAVAWRMRQHRLTMAMLWTTGLLSLGVWWLQGGNLRAAGVIPSGALWPTVLGLVAAAAAGALMLSQSRGMTPENARQVLASIDHDPLLRQFTPHAREERSQWLMVSLTAGITEEFIYRGVLLGLMTPLLGWWGAALFSLMVFSLGHLYQGASGMLRVLTLGGVLTLLVLASGSLWPAILLHILIDLSSGQTLIAAREMLTRKDNPRQDETATGPALSGAA